jgi:hypothetical protein
VSAPQPSQASASATALLHELAAALGEDPRSARIQQLRRRWEALIDAQSGGDARTRHEIHRAASRWRNWPDGMRRWVAHTYRMDVGTWERVMTLSDATSTREDASPS